MTGDHAKADRTWQEIVNEVSTEHDSEKVAELSQELIQAIDKQIAPQTSQPSVNSKRWTQTVVFSFKARTAIFTRPNLFW